MSEISTGESLSTIEIPPKVALEVEARHHFSEKILDGASVDELLKYQKGLFALQAEVGK
jgi:hypothetical protein